MYSEDRENALARLVADVRTFLKFHRDLGLENYPFPLPSARRKPESEVDIEEQTKRLQAASSGPTFVAGEEGRNPGTISKRIGNLQALALKAKDCCRCELGSRRQVCVFGEGTAEAELLVLTETPSPEDGKALVISGEERQLLEKMLAAINLTFAQVYLTSLVKCSPGKTQIPATEELAACQPFILQQCESVNPKAMLVLGEKPAQLLLKSSQPIFHLRGRVHDYHGTPAVVTYHPNQLNREPSLKRLSWQDLQLLRKELCRSRR